MNLPTTMIGTLTSHLNARRSHVVSLSLSFHGMIVTMGVRARPVPKLTMNFILLAVPKSLAHALHHCQKAQSFFRMPKP